MKHNLYENGGKTSGAARCSVGCSEKKLRQSFFRINLRSISPKVSYILEKMGRSEIIVELNIILILQVERTDGARANRVLNELSVNSSSLK